MARNFVKLDRFAPFQVGRLNRLSGNERWCLNALTLLADFRTHQWRGTLSDLADEMGVARRTAKTAIDRLSVTGLVDVLETFGPNSQGTIRVTCYEMLVVPASRRTAPNDANGDGENRAAFAPDSRSIRARSEPNGANAHAVTCGDATPRGIEASRDTGIVNESSETFGAWCGKCEKPHAECACPF